MSNVREDVLDWARQRRLTDVRRALALARATLDGAAWVRFASSAALWMGSVLLAASVVFFIAYNWDALGRFGKLALVEVLWLGAVVTAVSAGITRAPGKAALLAAALLTGALLALIGQTYQTGADTYELFATWAALILPWVLIARVAGLWLLWVALLNLAAMLYFQAFQDLLDVFLARCRNGGCWPALTRWRWSHGSGVLAAAPHGCVIAGAPACC